MGEGGRRTKNGRREMEEGREERFWLPCYASLLPSPPSRLPSSYACHPQPGSRNIVANAHGSGLRPVSNTGGETMATIAIENVEIFGKGVLEAEGVVIDKEGNAWGGGLKGRSEERRVG